MLDVLGGRLLPDAPLATPEQPAPADLEASKETCLTPSANARAAAGGRGLLLNGFPYDATTKRHVGFVPQDDRLYGPLTVAETLRYSAELRLPASVPAAQKDASVDDLIAELGLGAVRDARVGDAARRGVSGGERKRAAIGHELVHEPLVPVNFFAEHYFRSNALHCTTTARILIPAECSAVS